MGELARAGRTDGTRASYERYLFKFIDQVERSRPEADARAVTKNDCREFLDRWIGRDLRALNRSKAMEAVRDLSWSSSGFQSNGVEAHTGFEPVPPP